MGGIAYTALSGLRARFDQLDRLAGDIANTQTAGYKGERSTSEVASRPRFDELLQAAVDVRDAGSWTDFAGGDVVSTGRDLDVALDGPGFLVVQTPQGERYTRNGRLHRGADGTLMAQDGSPVLGEGGPVKLGADPVTFEGDGTIRTAKAVLGKLRLVEFDDTRTLARDTHARFQAGAAPRPADGTRVAGGALEQSNVSVVERLAELTEITRSFEALQRGLSLVSNDVDARAITELGRR